MLGDRGVGMVAAWCVCVGSEGNASTQLAASLSARPRAWPRKPSSGLSCARLFARAGPQCPLHSPLVGLLGLVPTNAGLWGGQTLMEGNEIRLGKAGASSARQRGTQ